MHRLILCEVQIMFHILQLGGSFVCKMFDISTNFTLSILYILHAMFEDIAIFKPKVSFHRFLLISGRITELFFVFCGYP